MNGVVTNFPEITYEYSSQGLLIKALEAQKDADPDVRLRTYREE